MGWRGQIPSAYDWHVSAMSVNLLQSPYYTHGIQTMRLAYERHLPPLSDLLWKYVNTLSFHFSGKAAFVEVHKWNGRLFIMVGVNDSR